MATVLIQSTRAAMATRVSPLVMSRIYSHLRSANQAGTREALTSLPSLGDRLRAGVPGGFPPALRPVPAWLEIIGCR